MEQLERDARFLATLNIMDYSLLVGIHDRSKRGQSSSSGGGVGGGSVGGGGGVGGVASSSGGVGGNGDARMRSNTPFRRRKQADDAGGGSRPDSGTFLPAISSTTTGGEGKGEGEGGGEVAGGGLDPSPPSSRPTSLPRKSAIAAAARGEAAAGAEREEGAVRFNNEGKKELRPSIAELQNEDEEEEEEEAFFVDDLDDRADEMGDEDDDDDLEQDEVDAGEESALEVVHFDEGDSDGDGASSSSSSSSLSQLVASSIFIEDDGLGLQGPEGKHLSRILKTGSADKLRRSNKKKLEVEKHLTFGPGQTQTHPWTSRKDSGVNSRIASTSHRGDEIYYMVRYSRSHNNTHTHTYMHTHVNTRTHQYIKHSRTYACTI